MDRMSDPNIVNGQYQQQQQPAESYITMTQPQLQPSNGAPNGNGNNNNGGRVTYAPKLFIGGVPWETPDDGNVVMFTRTN
jgi:hypothetical protein